MEPEDLLRFVVLACEQLGLRYLVTGSTATIAYGEPRFTNDIDIVLDLHAEQIDNFCNGFPAHDFYLSRQAVTSAVERKSQFNVIHPTSGLKVDFMVFAPTEFNTSRMLRGRDLPALEDRTVRFASPEDVILMKLKYFQEGGSEKHLRDIRGVLEVQGSKIDRDYIAAWAAKLDVVVEWMKAKDWK
ncbi:MAG: nucleotidyl transferase AbiEii/AbiGii toxin family protein [Planctomycetota bacterium]